MTSKQRRNYLGAALLQPHKWLAQCAANPSDYMTPQHVRLCLLAARILSRKA